MAALTGFHQRWEVRATLRLSSPLPDPPDPAVLGMLRSVEDALRTHPEVAFVNVGLEYGPRSEGVVGTLALARPSTPGAAVDEVTDLLAHACADVGLATDILKEVVAEPGDVDPRSL